MLLTRFCQDSRVRVRQPERNLQIKFTRPVSEKNDFVAYVDAIGNLDGTRRLLEWKTSPAVIRKSPRDSFPGPSAGLLLVDHRNLRSCPCGFCAEASARFSICDYDHGRAATGVWSSGGRYGPSN